MTDILLIQPPIQDFYLTSKRTIPYGLSCIASSLMKQGFSVEIFDSLATDRSRILDIPEEMTYLREYYNNPDISPFALFNSYKHFGYSFEHIGKIVKESKPFLVGISSLFTPYADMALKTAEVVKKNYPNCKIVLGGHHPTVMPFHVMQCKAVDFVLRGEGEISMPVLAKCLKADLDICDVPGIVFRKTDGTLHISEPEWITDLNKSPYPEYNLVKFSYYQRSKKKSISIAASRGCPMKCSYCSVSASSSNCKYRIRSIDSIIKEIKSIKNFEQIGFIDFEDENLTNNKKWFLELLSEIMLLFKDPKPELRAMNGLFPPSLDENIIKLMKKAGFKALNLSLGSSSIKQLKRFNRPDVRKGFDISLDLAKKYGLEAVAYIIIGAPFQDPEESVTDLLYLAQRRVLAGVSVYYPAPGSIDFQLCEKERIIPDKLSLMRSTALPLSHKTDRKKAITLLRLGRILNFMKFLIDNNISIPGKQSVSDNKIDSNIMSNRIEIGKYLLSGFFNDGEIRGVMPDSNIFKHNISTDITNCFINELKKIKLQGCNLIA